LNFFLFKTIDMPKKNKPKPELSDVIDSLSFEEKCDTLLEVSKELIKQIKRGKRFRGEILINIIGRRKFYIHSSREEQGGASLNNIGTVGPITNLDAVKNIKDIVENEYKQTVESLENFWTNKYPNVVKYLAPLKWRYTDTEDMYYNTYVQIVENYVTKSKVPRREDIVKLEIDGRIPLQYFHSPIGHGKDYFDDIKHSPNFPKTALGRLISWDEYIALDEKDPESDSARQKNIITKTLLSLYLKQFFSYLWKYRMAFAKEEVRYGYEFIEKLGSIDANIFNIAPFFATTPFYSQPTNQTKCPSGWLVKSYLGSGSYGDVFETCCIKQQCEYAIKIVKPINKESPRPLIEEEISMWKEIQSYGLSPRLIEYYDHSSSNPEEDDYFILVMETLDITLKKAIEMADRDNNYDLLELLFSKALDLLRELHSREIVHGDAHDKNYMFKCEDKTVYNSSQSLFTAITNGQCELKFIDFGFATSLDRLRRNYEFEVERHQLYLLQPRLVKLGCLDAQEPDIKTWTSLSYYEWLLGSKKPRENKLFDILRFYDVAELSNSVEDTWRNSKTIKDMIENYEKTISGINCSVGEKIDYNL